MCTIDYPGHRTTTSPAAPPRPPSPASTTPPRDADALNAFKEGVEWLLDAWASVLPTLPETDDPAAPPPEGADVVVRRARKKAMRLLGLPTAYPPPEQPLREAGMPRSAAWRHCTPR